MKLTFIAATALLACSAAQADLDIPMHAVNENGVGQPVGHIAVSETRYGLVFTPKLTGLPPGLHGFHLHENASCDAKEKDGKPVAALAAGGHYDPSAAGRHDSPWGNGHLGDLPPMFIDAGGRSTNPVLAPRLKLADLSGHSLMVHAGADNHDDHPLPLGGGGARIVCGVVR
jgi:Cu-Zn family superoxide dismutase